MNPKPLICFVPHVQYGDVWLKGSGLDKERAARIWSAVKTAKLALATSTRGRTPDAHAAPAHDEATAMENGEQGVLGGLSEEGPGQEHELTDGGQDVHKTGDAGFEEFVAASGGEGTGQMGPL